MVVAQAAAAISGKRQGVAAVAVTACGRAAAATAVGPLPQPYSSSHSKREFSPFLQMTARVCGGGGSLPLL